MSYIEAIIWLISWPVLIVITFQLIKYFLKKLKWQ